jgi:altronate dehydratase
MHELAPELNELTHAVRALAKAVDGLKSPSNAATKQDLAEMEKRIMATLDQVLQDVTDESTVIDSISTLVTGLKQQVADALSGATLPPAVQAKVDAVFAQAETNKAKLAAAVTTNTPAA